MMISLIITVTELSQIVWSVLHCHRTRAPRLTMMAPTIDANGLPVVTKIEEIKIVGHDTSTFSGKPYTRFRTQLTTSRGKTEHLIRLAAKQSFFHLFAFFSSSPLSCATVCIFK